MEVVIRKMNPEESKAVRRLGIKAFMGFESLFIPKPREALVALQGERIVAAVLLKYIAAAEQQKIGYMDFAFVDPSLKHSGIGKEIYREAIDYLWSQGCSEITALVKDDNISSWKLLSQNGFERIGLFQACQHLGAKGIFNHLIHTSLGWAFGMDFYLASKDRKIEAGESSSLQNMAFYLLINFLLFLPLFGLRNVPGMITFLTAYLAILLFIAVTGYLGTLFSKRSWKFRLVPCGFFIPILVLFAGGLFPLIGNWYPSTYEKSSDFKRDLGLNSWFSWIALLLISIVTLILGTEIIILRYLYQISTTFLIFRVLALYPFSGFGGSRVFQWNKWIYGITSILSVLVVWI